MSGTVIPRRAMEWALCSVGVLCIVEGTMLFVAVIPSTNSHYRRRDDMHPHAVRGLMGGRLGLDGPLLD